MGRPCGNGALRLVLLAAWVAPVARADSVIDILGNLKTFRDASLGILESASTTLKESGETEDAAKVQKWSDDWLSILGVSTGLTGLAKDFVVNYLGRSAYHDSNGALIAAIKEVSMTFPTKVADFDDDTTNAIRQRIIVVCREGMALFESGGSLHTMLSELRAILKTSNTPHYTTGLKSNAEIKKVFQYVSGKAPPSAIEEL